MSDEIYIASHQSSDKDRVLFDENFIDLPDTGRDRFIYRIISLSRLFQLFSSQANFFVKPKKWADPFENFILHSRIRYPSGKIFAHGNRDAIYGQCWTLQSASDAMWRIYSPKGDAVQSAPLPGGLRKASSSLPPFGPIQYASARSGILVRLLLCDLLDIHLVSLRLPTQGWPGPSW